MIKAGLLGWLRFLPLGEAALPGWGTLFITIGAAALIAAALYGCFQSHPKALLAYSSISKMGLMTLAVGVVLAEPESVQAIIGCILIYATHHGLTKGALFLSVSLDWKAIMRGPLKWLNFLLLLTPPLSLAGFALTGGAAAKISMKSGVTAFTNPGLQSGFSLLLTVSSLITAALMIRFCWQQFSSADQPLHAPRRSSYLGWASMAGIVGVNPVLLTLLYPELNLAQFTGAGVLWSSVWPVLLVAGGALVLLLNRTRFQVGTLPPGDILYLYTALTRPLSWVIESTRKLIALLKTSATDKKIVSPTTLEKLPGMLRHSEMYLSRAAVFGLVFIGLMVVSTILLLDQL